MLRNGLNAIYLNIKSQRWLLLPCLFLFCLIIVIFLLFTRLMPTLSSVIEESFLKK